uniref:Uncharacterized protein n=1 Tax=Arundo donax TaxID=35708 RepID=A0A0A9F0T1_ARUDO
MLFAPRPPRAETRRGKTACNALRAHARSPCGFGFVMKLGAGATGRGEGFDGSGSALGLNAAAVCGEGDESVAA